MPFLFLWEHITHTHTHTHLGAHSCEWYHRENLIDAIPFPMRTYHSLSLSLSLSHTHTHTHTHPESEKQIQTENLLQISTEFPFLIKSNKMFSTCQRLPSYKPRLSLSPHCALPITWVHLLFLVNQITCSSCDISIFSYLILPPK